MTDSPQAATDGGSSYCSNCGSALEASDSFCSDCGDPVDDSASTATDQTEDSRAEGRRAFRSRVRRYLAEGWEVQYDAGDEVVLVDRNFGSGWVHLLLFLTTGGLGNCVYGWYNYERTANRVVLRAEDVDTESAGTARSEYATGHPEYAAEPAPADYGPAQDQYAVDPAESQYAVGDNQDDTPLSHYIGGIFLFLLGIYIIATSLLNASALLFGIGVTLAALLVFPPVRERLRDRHPPTTFGPTETVDERAVSETDQLCSVCRDPIDEGVVSEYEKEYVVAGFPLYTMEAGENWYCESCHKDRHQFDTGSEFEAELETELN